MKKAIIWDLLGTLGGNSSTLINEFVFFKETIPALKKAQEFGFLNIVITNQSQIAHGRLSMEVFKREVERLIEELKETNVFIEKVYVCPHRRSDSCKCKKPLPALVYKAKDDFELELEQCYIVGDSGKNDMLLAYETGIKGVLVLTGEGKESVTTDREYWKECTPHLVAESVLDAIDKICL
ncbi:MAG: HAD-IIIA family hydrolase [Alkalibacterium sp.]|nr:HAD-IIIA family hydrolase [Alkalibacterium sp.]